MRLDRLFFRFHGRDSRTSRSIEFHVPRGLVRLGKAVAIEYECDKLHGGGDGKRAVYRHEFETPVHLCMDEKARRQLYMIGNQVIITDAGIER